MDDSVAFGGSAYLGWLGLLMFSRGMDLLSTWIASPNLVLEANPLAKKLGWKGNIALSVGASLCLALWPMPAIIVSTASVLVAARNFQQAWLMRSLGEEPYRAWQAGRIQSARLPLFLLCLAAQTALTAGVGVVLIYFCTGTDLVAISVGVGIVAYAGAIGFYSLLSVWRIRRAMG